MVFTQTDSFSDNELFLQEYDNVMENSFWESLNKNGEKNNLEQEIDSSGKYLTKLFKNNFLIEIETEIKNINSFCEKYEKIEKIVEFYNSQLMSKFNLNIGYLYEIIDARFEIVREQNTPISINNGFYQIKVL